MKTTPIANTIADRRRALQLDRQRKRQRRSPTVWPKLNVGRGRENLAVENENFPRDIQSIRVKSQVPQNGASTDEL